MQPACGSRWVVKGGAVAEAQRRRSRGGGAGAGEQGGGRGGGWVVRGAGGKRHRARPSPSAGSPPSGGVTPETSTARYTRHIRHICYIRYIRHTRLAARFKRGHARVESGCGTAGGGSGLQQRQRHECPLEATAVRQRTPAQPTAGVTEQRGGRSERDESIVVDGRLRVTGVTGVTGVAGAGSERKRVEGHCGAPACCAPNARYEEATPRPETEALKTASQRRQKRAVQTYDVTE